MWTFISKSNKRLIQWNYDIDTNRLLKYTRDQLLLVTFL